MDERLGSMRQRFRRPERAVHGAGHWLEEKEEEENWVTWRGYYLAAIVTSPPT